MHCCSQQVKQSHASHFSILHLTVLSRVFSTPAAVFHAFVSFFCSLSSPLDISKSTYFTGFLRSTLTFNGQDAFPKDVHLCLPKKSSMIHYSPSNSNQVFDLVKMFNRVRNYIHTTSTSVLYISPPFLSLCLILFILLLLLLLSLIIMAILHFFSAALTIIYLPTKSSLTQTPTRARMNPLIHRCCCCCGFSSSFIVLLAFRCYFILFLSFYWIKRAGGVPLNLRRNICCGKTGNGLMSKN